MSGDISVLIVDDDPEIRFATSRVLKSAGYTVYEAEDKDSCLRMVREQKPDLILLDVVLPNDSGYEVCRQIKTNAEWRGIYVILLSGIKTSSEDQSEGLEQGADGYIARPVTNRELLARVRAMERIIKAERERDQLVEQLQRALSEIKTLKGFLPICASCKRVRDDKGYWTQIEMYIREHTEAEFTHGICPECLKKLYHEVSDNPDEV